MNILTLKEFDIEDLVQCNETCSSCPYELRAYCGFIPNEYEKESED